MTKRSGSISNRRNDSATRPSQARDIGRSIEGSRRVAALAIALAALLLVGLPLLAQSPSEILHRDDFQSYGTQVNPPGWVDTAIGNPGPVADGLYKTWPDPTQGNKATNVVYGTKSASGKPEGRNPRIGTFSTLTTKEFDARGRFEFSGRLIRTRDDGRIGVTFLSQYPNADKYYLLGLWSQPTSSKLTMQLFAFDKSLDDPANPLGDQSARLKGTRDTGVTLDVNAWYRFFIRVDDADGQTKISARLWKDGSSEPAAFQIEAEDDSAQRLTKGRIGLWTAVKGDSYIDEILAKSPIDHSGPAIRFLRRTTAGDVDLATGFETNADVTPIIVVTDDTDPNPTVTATLDGAPFTSGTTVTTEGTHVIVVRATDSLGNKSDGTVSFYVDKTAPKVVAFEGADPLNVVTEGRVFDRDISLNLQIDDLSSATVVATLDGQPFVPGTALAPAPLYGVEKHPHELVATVRDRVGNETAVGPLRFTIDKTAPEVTITRDGAPFSGGGFNTAIALAATVDDLTPAPLTMTLNGQPYVPRTPIAENRQHTVTASATDLAEHTTTSTITFVVNQNAPGVRILENGEALPKDKYFKRPVSPTIEIDNSIPPSVQVTLDGSPWPVTLESVSGNIYLYSNGPIATDGTHTIAVVASDAAGNETPASVTFTIDQVAPSLTILESGAPLADGTILGRDAIVTAEATDAIGPVTTTLEVDGLPFTSGNAITASGVYTVTATASDKAGNETSAGPLRLTIDKIAPEVSLLESGEEFPVDHWFNRDVVPSIAISDLTAVTIVVTIDGTVATFTRSSVDGMSSTWAGPTVATEGEHTIGVRVTDQIGLETTLPPLHFWIDKTPPAITLATPEPSSVVVAATVALSGAAGDAVSVTVNGTPATVDPLAKSWSLAAVALLEGSNTLTIAGTDRAGNLATVTPSLILDTRGPALQVLSPANGSCTNASSLGIQGTASDARLASVTISVDGQAPVAAQLDLGTGTWSATLPGVAEGLHQITITSADSAGHTSTASLAVRVDRTPPVIEVTEGGAPFAISKLNRAVSLFVRAVDADPSVALTSTLDGGSFFSGSAIGGEGSHTLVVSARDCAGNEQQKTVSFTIDLTAPVFTSISPANGATVGTMPSSVAGTVSSDATSVRLLAAGSPSIEAAVSNGSFTLPGVPFEEGTNRFTLHAVDDAGNDGSVDYAVTVRTAVPVVEITENGRPIAPNALFNRDVTPEIRANDADATITATLDSAVYSIGTAITTDGSHTLSATATDSLGHAGTKSVTFTIDKTAPVVTITAPAAGASIASDTTTVTGTASDATSVTVNGAAATLSGGSFSATVPLELGENVLVAVGRDDAGNAGRAEVTVTRAGVGPAIVLLYPADKSLTNRPRTEVRGRVITPANVQSVTIALVAAHSNAPPFSTIVTPDAAGDFRATLDLVEGPNAISATSLGKDGKSATAAIEVTADFTAPVLQLRANGDELRDGARFASSAALTLDVSDAQTASPDVALSVDGTTSVAPVTITAEGGHVALATARDAAGNEARIERSFSIGAGSGTPAGCSLTQLDPKAGSIISATSTRVAGRTSAPGVKVGGVLADVVDGSFCVSVELPAEGANDIAIVCVDASGNTIGDAVTHTLQRVTGDPSVAITSPAESASIDKNASGTISVSGTAGPGVVAVTVNGVRKALDSGIDTQRDFTVDGVRLGAGLNIIAARAETASLRAATVTRRVVYLADEPSISITSPVGTVVTGASTIDVSGTWANLDPATLGAGLSIHSFGDSAGSFLLPGVPLTAGANTITISGSNAAGRPATASIVVTRTAGIPSVAISEPADNSYVASDSAVVRGTAEAAEGSTVQVNGVAANATAEALGDGRVRISFEATVSVSASGAITPIVARVSEPAGGGVFDTIRVTRFSGAFAVRADDELTPLVFPAPNAVQVPTTVQTLVAFTHAIDKATVLSGGVTLVAANGQAVSGVTRVDRDVVSFAPSAPLADGTTYTIKVAATVRDLAGAELGTSYESSFVTAISAPRTAPQVTSVPAAVCGTTLGIDGTAVPNARVQLDSGSWQFFATASATGAFHFDLPLTGQSGYQLVRVRTVGTDGSLSPAADVCVRVDCGGVRVTGASYDASANSITILFSGAIDAATLGVGSSITLTGATGAAIGGSVVLTAPTTATITPERSLADETFTLGVTTAVRDARGNALTAPFSQSFFAGGGTATGNPGDGYLTGEVFDASTGRPLAGALVAPASSPAVPPTSPSAVTDSRGRYTIFVPEGAHTLEVSAPGYTTVWRQIVVPAGAGVVPIDVRLEKRGVTKSVTSGELSLTDGSASAIAKPVALTIAAGSLTSGSAVTLTSVGAQSLAGLLPLGWSPLASAEVVVTASPSGSVTASVAVIPSAARDLQKNLTASSAANVPLTATLRFTVDATAIANAAQTLSAVRYDAIRDEWQVVNAAISVDSESNTATLPIASTGAYALVYPDKISGLTNPQPPTSGLPLQGVSDPCLTAAACGPLTKQSFTLNPAIVAPDQRTTATLEVTSELSVQHAALFPSGTAVQAYIDEELTLSDGSTITDPPFATDLILYRDLDGAPATATFHLAPSKRATEVFLQVGWEHIRILPYPGRLDRGTLIGNEGGRVPGDGSVTVDIPAGATPEPVRAEVHPIQDLTPFGTISGFTILSAFEFELSRATQLGSSDLDGDGQPDSVAPIELLKSANATFALQTTETRQLILAEVLGDTSYGTVIQLASVCSVPTAEKRVTTLVRLGLPLDGIIREGRYLLLAANDPIAYATGLVRLGSATGPVVSNAKVSSLLPVGGAQPLGVTDLTRATGVFAVPTAVGSYSLIPRHTTTGDGLAQAAAAPNSDAIVPVTLVLAPQPPILTLVEPTGRTEVSLKTRIVVQSDKALDPSTFGTTPIVVKNALTGEPVAGTIASYTSATLQITFTPTNDLKPNSRYTVTVSPTIRAINNAPVGQTYTFSFATVTQFVGTGVDRSKVRITIPNQFGASTVSGDPGFATNGFGLTVVRRNRDFVHNYQGEVRADGGFTMPIGDCDNPSLIAPCGDAISITDTIDLQVLNTAGILTAVIRLTPFASADGRGFVAPVGEETRFTTVDNITIAVPAGAFDTPTMIRATPSMKAVFAEVPNIDHEWKHMGGVRLEFDGVAKKRLDIDFPTSANPTAGRQIVLGRFVDSVRGPRMTIADILRVANGRFSTTFAPTPAGKAAAEAALTHPPPGSSVLIGDDAKRYMNFVDRQGEFAAYELSDDVGIQAELVWAAMETAQFLIEGAYSIISNIFLSYILPDEYVVESRGRVVVPVLKGREFSITGINSDTGFDEFTRQYRAITDGSAGAVVLLDPPDYDLTGPYPVFATPSDVTETTLESAQSTVGGLRLSLSNELLSVTRAEGTTLAKGSTVQIVNLSTGAVFPKWTARADGSLITDPVRASKHHRILILRSNDSANPESDLSVVFNEPIWLPSLAEGTADEDQAYLASVIKLTQMSAAGPADLSDHVTYVVDSNGRRIYLVLPAPLARGTRYRLTLSKALTDRGGNKLATIGQVNESGNVSWTGGGDLSLELETKSPAGALTSFDLTPADVHESGAVRDLARIGNLAFVSARDGGIVVYDLADPAFLTPNGTLQPKPYAVVPARWSDAQGSSITPGLDEHWGIATDHHGRIYSAGFAAMYGTVRSYRIEDFVAANKSTLCEGFANAPAHSNCHFDGSVIVSWKPGYTASLPTTSQILLSDRPEGTPRTLKILAMDDEESYSFEELKGLAGVSSVTEGEFESLSVPVKYRTPDERPYYISQRITIENTTLGNRWSADVRVEGSETIKGVLGRKGDRFRILRNRRTYALVSLFGYGVNLIDMNAVESNDQPQFAGYARPREQRVVTSVSAEASETTPIRDVALSPEAVVVPGGTDEYIPAFAPDSQRGLLGFVLFPGEESFDRGDGLVLRNRTTNTTHPRLARIDTVFEARGRTLRTRFSSVAHYRGRQAPSAPFRDYVLLAGGDYGLLAVQVGEEGWGFPNINIDNDSLVGAVWIPDGAWAVRHVEGTSLAVVVDGVGRVLLVDLSRIDEIDLVESPDELFPTTLAALTAAGDGSRIGADDPRILWQSETGVIGGTIAPLVDPVTGVILGGRINERAMTVLSAFEHEIAMLWRTSNGLEETSGNIPLGVGLPASLTARFGENEAGNAAAFRLTVTLPRGLARALADKGGKLRVAVESELVPGAIAKQTEDALPPSHLRLTTRAGAPEKPSRRTEVVLEPLVPAGTNNENAWQSSSNTFVSPWIVGVADPRASQRYAGTAPCVRCGAPAELGPEIQSGKAFELFTAGRHIGVRLEHPTGQDPLTGTGYEYLGRDGRLTARFATVIGETLRDPAIRVAAQNAPAAEGMFQETTWLHSGEVESANEDLRIAGRGGMDVVVDRSYHSRTIGGSGFGLGWESGLFRRLRPLPDGTVEYRDEAGEIWVFTPSASTAPLDAGEQLSLAVARYNAPRGLFLKLVRTERGFTMYDQEWRITTFDPLGRLTTESDEFFSPTAAAAGEENGNTIRYVYDAGGALTEVVDPLGRATKLTWWSEADWASAGAYPGLVRTVADWRGRSVQYQYDTFGRMTKVLLPEVAASARVPVANGLGGSYSFTGNQRPRIEYGYASVVPPIGEMRPTQAYNDYLEFAGNLTAIKDPREALKSNGTPRVTFAYDATTDAVRRDRVLTQTWPCGTVNETCTPVVAKLPYASGLGMETLDALGQRRSYDLTTTAQFDGRVHVAKETVHAVETLKLAGDILPAAAPVTPPVEGRDFVTSYVYDEHGQLFTSTRPSGVVVTNAYKKAANGAPGMVLASAKETPPNGTPIETVVAFDTAPNAANTPVATGRREGDGEILYRDDQAPSRDRLTVERRDDGVRSAVTFDKQGQLRSASKFAIGSDAPAMSTSVDYHDTSGTNPIAAGMPKRVVQGGEAVAYGMDFASAAAGGVVQTLTDTKNNTKTVTERDAYDRPVREIVTGPDGEVLSEELSGYDADGNLAYAALRQTDGVTGEVRFNEEAYEYDIHGRLVQTKSTGAWVGDGLATLVSRHAYDLAARTVTESDPVANENDPAAREISILDGLGRVVESRRVAPAGDASLRQRVAYDIHGNAAFSSDSVRVASLVQHDAFGRAVASVASDGTRTKSSWNAWDELVASEAYDSAGQLVGKQNFTYSRDGEQRRIAEQIDASGAARLTRFTWDDGERNLSTRVGGVGALGADLGLLDSVRVQQTVKDEAGRVVEQKLGEALGPESLLTPDKTWGAMRVTAFKGEQPSEIETSEPRAGRAFQRAEDVDALGRTRQATEAGTYVTTTRYDEAGNVTQRTEPGMSPATMRTDGRGLPFEMTLPGGGTVRQSYDALGNLRTYTSEAGELISYETDGLGRVHRTRYPDNTCEETVYEDLTGAVAATRDRAGQWLIHRYDAAGRVSEVLLGGSTPCPAAGSPPALMPTAVTPWARYTYDDAGRLTRAANKDAAIEFEQFDMLGRPALTRTIRYSNGSGLASADIFDVHVQGHVWSVYDGERSRWRMPAAGSVLPNTEPDSPWRSWIAETIDGGANLVEQSEALGATAPPLAVISEASSRGMMRLAQRKRPAGSEGQMLTTRFGYADGAGIPTTPTVEVVPSSPGPASGLLGRTETLLGATVIAGSEVTRDAAKRAHEARDLRRGGRSSRWDYDERGRLAETMIAGRSGSAVVPYIRNAINAADFATHRSTAGRLTPSQRTQLGDDADEVEPPSWASAPGPGQRIESRRPFAYDPSKPLAEQSLGATETFAWDGGRRTSDGEWISEFDAEGRRVAVSSVAAGRRIEYAYDPRGRIVGRTALRLGGENAWVLEDREAVLTGDGLPAETTWVWDPTVDRLTAIYAAGASVAPGATAEAGLLRQIVHGGQQIDDPVEVLIRQADSSVRRLLPVVDGAAGGSVEAVVDGGGAVVEEVLYADAYGDAPRYLAGPVVDRISLHRASSGQREIRVHLTANVVAETTASGVRIVARGADGTELRVAETSVSVSDRDTVVASMTPAQWTALVADAASVEVQVTGALRAEVWGEAPVQPAAPWQVRLGAAASKPGAPVVVAATPGAFDAGWASSAAADADGSALYEVSDLYLVASASSRAKLLFGFQALPYREPATGDVFARNRWYDPSTANFISPDPMGTRDSSNLYAFAGFDPVNRRDPLGLSAVSTGKKLVGEALENGPQFVRKLVGEVGDDAIEATAKKAAKRSDALLRAGGFVDEFGKANLVAGKTAARKRSAKVFERYGGEKQRNALLRQVREARARKPGKEYKQIYKQNQLREAKGIVTGFRQMRDHGYELEDVVLKYRGNQGVDLLFSKRGRYAVLEAKHSGKLGSLKKYLAGRQGSAGYNIIRLERYARSEGSSPLVERLLKDADLAQLESFVSLHRSRRLFELPVGWPKSSPILRSK